MMAPLTSLPVNRLTATDCNANRSCQYGFLYSPKNILLKTFFYQRPNGEEIIVTGNILKKVFFIKGLEVGEMIPYPVLIIPYPSLKIVIITSYN